MGRPKKDSGELSAAERIEKAFWYILEEEGYSAVTILRLSQESGLNKNSIYYHFENVEDIAEKAFRHTIDDVSRARFFTALLTRPKDLLDPDLLDRVRKVHLFARSDSAHLHQLLLEYMTDAWFQQFHIEESCLTKEERIQLGFIFAGVISMLGNRDYIDDPKLLVKFPSTPIGKASLKTLLSLATRHT